jgi:hypothetical protein
MLLSRPRLSMRWMMIAVACVSILLAYGERCHRYKRLAAYHDRMVSQAIWEADKRRGWTFWGMPSDSISLFHRQKSEAYKNAAMIPWVSVEPESPPSVDPEPVHWATWNDRDFQPTPSPDPPVSKLP